jgi:membrane protein implicated in regulation of membrane protease activity
MAIQYWWWVLALGIGILEMLTGTFYLLMLALGVAAGGALAALGGPLWSQCVAAAVVALAGSFWVRRSRAGAPAAGPTGRNPDVVADVGERVRVAAWDADGRARVQYRGTQWTAELAPGETAEPGEYRIREVAGNRLILARP